MQDGHKIGEVKEKVSDVGYPSEHSYGHQTASLLDRRKEMRPRQLVHFVN